MNEPLDLPVSYKNQQLYFKAQLLLLGYTHKFTVEVNGEDLLFEPDEERNYRAVIAYEKLQDQKQFEKELMSAIAEAIESVTRVNQFAQEKEGSVDNGRFIKLYPHTSCFVNQYNLLKHAE